jgi:hypothetical protein
VEAVMSVYSDTWASLDLGNRGAVCDFKLDTELDVARKFPWMTGELFTLEGDLGWGPGFREWDGPDYFPPMRHEALQKMKEFCTDLDTMKPESLLDDFIRSLRQKRDNIAVSMLKSCERASEKQRVSVVHKLYASVVNAHPLYTIGAACIYLSVWLVDRKYLLAVSGLLWLLCNPLTKRQALLQKARNKMECGTSALINSSRVQEMPAAYHSPENVTSIQATEMRAFS